MDLPNQAQWDRVEELADELSHLSPRQISERLSDLAAAGEPRTVLTLLGAWLSLPLPPSCLSSGAILGGRYVLKEKLGHGGMGEVWRASQELISRDVAIKIIHPSLVTPALQARFAAETQALGQLNHPGIVSIFDAGVHTILGGPPIPFFAMELVEGQPLHAWAASRRAHRLELLRVISEMCAALASAHEREIVHRDLKPGNILVRANGHPVIVDFGIARLRGLVLGDEEGLFSGTPQYAAPEQHLGRDHDFRSGESVDIYAVGAILFEILSGRKLFQFPPRASVAEVRRAVLETPLPRLSQALEDCPLALDEIVSRALRRDPADRFYSVAALGRAVDRIAAGMRAQAPPPRWTPAPGAGIPQTSWVLTEKIGQGGAGEVWLGRHQQLGESRVFKFCNTDEKARTLKREVTLFRLLKERVGRNPHFITLHEVSLDEPPFYLMMDHVGALELDAWCNSQPGGLSALPEQTRLEIIIQAADALQAAHEAGILHRDIKPANLLVRNSCADLHLYIADFGIGQIAADQLLRDATRLGFTHTVSNLRTDRLSGTLLYLAPEVLEGSPGTARSDLYSLGVVLWQLLVGNLHAALDPSDWHERISDPILREDLRGCLAGVPEKRWASAGELAARLRALPDRRAAEQRRANELAARERAAYRRGVLKTALVAAAVIAVVASLAAIAFAQRRVAERARGEIAVEQAHALFRSDFTAGRKARGLQLLEVAAKTSANLPELRSAAAAVFALADLVEAAPPAEQPDPAVRDISKLPGEVLRALSPDGSLLAIARDVDGLNGAVDLFDARTGAPRATITRKDFPWVPIAERGLLSFSQQNDLVAVGGAATSRHIVLFETATGAARSYIFHGSDPLTCAWHPSGTILASGCADGTIRIWDLQRARSAKQNGGPGNQFDLPPALDVPALDVPLHVLREPLGPVDHLAFSPEGTWLVALDRTGYLRVFEGFASASSNHALPSAAPALLIEARVEKIEQVVGLSATADSVVLKRRGAPGQKFTLIRSTLPEELPLAPDLTQLAWNDSGRLCAVTLTDTYWLQPSSLRILFHQPGNNPIAVAWNRLGRSWMIPAEDRLDEFKIHSAHDGANRLRRLASFRLLEREKGQASLTGLAVAQDGRAAVYYGGRIQFFHRHSAGPTNTSVLANGAGGQFRNLLWDEQGRLLGAVFSLSNGAIRVECWRTSADFPPNCEQLSPTVMDVEQVTTANDGAHLIARSVRDGLFSFNPADASRVMIDSSNAARQMGRIACDPSGRLLAMVIDRNLIRLLKLPDGALYADLPRTRRSAAITALQWDPSGRRLASLTEDGCVQVRNLAPWQQWLSAHGLSTNE